jgi:hypothetical protein
VPGSFKEAAASIKGERKREGGSAAGT